MERWLPVVGFEGFYEVSDMGRVRSVARMSRAALGSKWTESRVLKNIRSSLGYAVVNMTKGAERKQGSVHRMVLEAFVGECPKGEEACHMNGDRMDGRLENLRWDTRKSNHADKRSHGTWQGGVNNGNSKLTWREVEGIRASRLSAEKLAKMYGVGSTTIFRVKNYESWDSDLAKEIGCYGD